MKGMGTLHIKNMVCPRCIMAVRQCLESLGMHPRSIELGTALLPEPLDEDKRRQVAEALQALGFELIDDRRSQLIEQIKTTVIDLVHYHDKGPKSNLSDYLSAKLNREYSALSKLFSETTGTTIEKYFIAQKIERAKELLVYDELTELLVYDELTLNELADLLGYSSAAYLSTQFKQVTGLTPSHFKQLKENKRKSLDQV